MTPLRTPLEVALGTRLPLDFSDLDLEDLDKAEADFEAHEAELLAEAEETGERLYRESVRASIPGMGVQR